MQFGRMMTYLIRREGDVSDRAMCNNEKNKQINDSFF